MSDDIFIKAVLMKFKHEITDGEIRIFKTKDNGKTLLGQVCESIMKEVDKELIEK